jgi:environmental stress-induced protein Ves
MRDIRHLTAADVRRVAWKNGRGTTEELALWPHHASFERNDFEWRISRAAIDANGPFSVFPDFDRILVVTRGSGLLLEHGEAAPRARLRRFEPYRFAGEWPTRAALPAGPVSDFNVLVRSDACDADVEVLQLGPRRSREPIGREHLFVHALSGSVVARVPGEEDPFELEPGESLWMQGLALDEEVDLAGAAQDCVVILVRLGPASA